MSFERLILLKLKEKQ
jgi:hypothetical protein